MTREGIDFVRWVAPQIEQTRRKEYIWFAFLISVVLLAIYAFITQEVKGHIVTGMRDNVVWGIYIVNFIFFMGVSYAGAIVSGSLHLFEASWRKPVVRIAEFTTVFSLLIGPVFILLCIGRLDRLPYIAFFGRIQSPIVWDVIAITTDIFGCLIYLYLALLRDFAFLRDNPHLKVPKWKKKFYRVLSLNYKDTPEQRIKLDLSMNIMSAMVIAIAIIVYSVLAWIFSVTLQPGWHSTIFGPYFVIAAVFSGVAVMILIMWIYRKVYHLEELFQEKHFVNMGVVLLVLAALFGYFTFSEYLTKWYGSEKNDEQLIKLLFSRYYWEFVLSNYAGVLYPLIVVGLKRFRTINNITFAALLVVISLWINRYLIVIPTLESPYFPIQDTRPEWVHYLGTWVEWTLTAGGVAMFALLFSIGAKFFPIVQVTKMHDEYEDIERVEYEKEREF